MCVVLPPVYGRIGQRGLRRLASLELAQSAGGFPRVPVRQTAGRVVGRTAHPVAAEILQHLLVQSVAPAQSTPHRCGGHVQD